jgi:hypothetical protein
MRQIAFTGFSFRAVLFFLISYGLNFIIFLQAAFLYESFARSLFVLEVKVQLFICARILAQMLVKLTPVVLRQSYWRTA